MKKIFWAADSTVQYNNILTYPQTGMGQTLGLYLKDDVVIENHAKNGRSTLSFMTEGRLDEIDKRIQAGDYLFIQFGHNDEKSEDPARYTTAFGTYQENLMKYAEVARKHGAKPVFISSLSRRLFNEDGTYRGNSHEEYQKAMKELAEKENIPFIDLCAKSMDFIVKMGDEATKQYFMNFSAGLYENYPEGKADNTHLRYAGAVKFAGMIAEGLKELGGEYAEMVLSKE